MGASPSSEVVSESLSDKNPSENGGLFDQLMDVFNEEANEEVELSTCLETTGAENAEEQFYEGVQQLHLARGESRILDVLLWLAVLQECCQELELENVDGDGASIMNEILQDCERMVLMEVKSLLANIYQERIDKKDNTLKSAELDQMKIACDNVGLKVSIQAGQSKRSLSPKNNGSSDSRTYNSKHSDMLDEETPTAKKRENALNSLSESCQSAVSSLLQDDAQSESNELFRQVRLSFDRCIVLGANEKAIASYGKALRKGLIKAMDHAVSPLEVRATTRKQFVKMKKESQGDMDDNEISMNDGDDPQPHVASMTRVLSRASIVLAEVKYTSFRCKSSSSNNNNCDSSNESAELVELLSVMAKDASVRACKVLKHFRAELNLQDIQMTATRFLSGDMESNQRESPPSSSGSIKVPSPPPLDTLKLDSVLVDMSELLAFCQRFMSFLKGCIDLSPNTVSDLPLFVDSLQLAASYVDIETAYCFFNIKKSLFEAETLEASQEVHISSIVEDCFFVIRDKSLERALSTGSEQSILAICSRVVETLEVQAPEPSLYLAVLRLPKQSCDQSLTTIAVESYKAYKRQQLEGIKNKTKQEVTSKDESVSSYSSNDAVSEGSDSVHSERFESLLKGFSDHLNDLSLGIDDDEVSSLLSLIIATNTADACAASIMLLQDFIIEVLHEVGLSEAFIGKVAQSSVGDLARISSAYTQLRLQFVERLLDEHLGHNFKRFKAKLKFRSFAIEKDSQSKASKTKKKVLEKTESVSVDPPLPVKTCNHTNSFSGRLHLGVIIQ